ncbi:hypothetical protein ACLOJK_006196 [Asimina triloba]
MATDHDGLWTNERHISFLNWIEASFVRRMLQNKDPRLLTCARGDRHHLPRLDRFLPDSAESTRDFDERRRRDRTRASNGMCEGREKARKGSICPPDASADQVGSELQKTRMSVQPSTLTCTARRVQHRCEQQSASSFLYAYVMEQWFQVLLLEPDQINAVDRC